MEYYYISAENKAEGPVTLEKLQALLGTGEISAATKVAAVGTQEWIPIADVFPVPMNVPSSSAPPMPQGTNQPPFVVVSSGGTEPLAVVSMVMSLIGLCLCCYGYPLWIAGVVCGHISLYRLKQNPLLQGRGMALAGLWIGYIAIVVWTLILFIAFVTGMIDGINQARYGD